MRGTTDEQRDVQLAAASSGGAYAAGARPSPRSYQQPGDARRAPDDGEPQRVLPSLTPSPPPLTGRPRTPPRPRSPSRRPGSRAVGRVLGQAAVRTAGRAQLSCCCGACSESVTRWGWEAQENAHWCRCTTRDHRWGVDRPRPVGGTADPGDDGGDPRGPAMTGPHAVEARETSGATTGGLLRYVRRIGGDEAVARVLELADVPVTAEELDDQSRWWSYDTRIRLFAAATEVLDDPQTMFKVGASALHSGPAHSLVILLRAMGSPRQVYSRLPRAVAKFSTTSTMEIVESGAVSATVRYRLHPGYVHSRLDCEYAQGLMTTVPTVFGLPPARIVHEECESDGHPVCVYHLTWERRSLLRRRRRDDASDDPELPALRGQLRILQSAATELVGSDDLDTALNRIVARAAQAVLAPAYLLAVRSPDGGEPLVHSAGLPARELPAMAAALLA